MRTASLILSFLLLCLSANAQPQEFMHNGAKYRLFPDQPRYAELVEDSTARDTVRIPSFVDYESIPREVRKSPGMPIGTPAQASSASTFPRPSIPSKAAGPTATCPTSPTSMSTPSTPPT